MSQRDEYPHGVPCWMTTIQPDPEAARAFYAGLFGWDYEDVAGYATAKLRSQNVAAVAPLPPTVEPRPHPAWMTEVCVDSTDVAAEAATKAGGTVFAEPFDGPTGRMAVIADPAGAGLVVKEPAPNGIAQLVNEPGAWAMSQLQTPDPAAVTGFYGAVFGWTTERFELGGSAITMFHVPGYVGGEPQQPVSREVVATMMEAQSGAATAWNPDFWVDDVDAAAAQATATGGRTLIGPFDMGIGRSAVLADPAGVPFSVTRMG